MKMNWKTKISSDEETEQIVDEPEAEYDDNLNEQESIRKKL